MKKLCFILAFSLPAVAQSTVNATTTWNESITYAPASASGQTQFKPGMNLVSAGSFDNNHLYKNLVFGSNPGEEGTFIQMDFPETTGTSTSFTTQTFYLFGGATAFMQSNYILGTDEITASTTTAKGCIYSIASVTLSAADLHLGQATFNYGPNPTRNGTVDATCTVAPASGENRVHTFRVLLPLSATPVTGCYLANGATATLDATNPYDGHSSLKIDTTASGAFANCPAYFDNSYFNRNISLDGTYTASLHVRGSAAFYQGVRRDNSPYVTNITGPNITPASASTWQAVSTSINLTGAAGENTTLPAAAPAEYDIAQYQGGVNYYDDLSLTDNADTSPGLFRKQEVQYLADHFAGHGGSLRSWVGGDQCVIESMTGNNAPASNNCLKPYMSAYQVGDVPGTINAVVGIPYQDLLALNEQLGTTTTSLGVAGAVTTPYWELPCPATDVDAALFIEILASTNTTTGGGLLRSSLMGHSQPYIGITGTLPSINISFCNEAWNAGVGSKMNDISTSPNQYVQYLNRASLVNAAMAADSAFDPTRMKLGVNSQVDGMFGFDTEFNKMHTTGRAADFAEISGYELYAESNYQTTEAEWRANFNSGFANSVQPGINNFGGAAQLVRGLTTAGPSGTVAPYINIYEYANGTLQSCGGNYPACSGANNQFFTQTVVQQLNAGAGSGIAEGVQAELFENTYGVGAQDVFGMSGYENPTVIGNFTASLWSTCIDYGGAVSKLLNAPYACRLKAYIEQAANACKIGAKHSGTNNAPTANYAADVNGPTPALTAVPILYNFVYTAANGQRCHAWWNTSLLTTYNVTEAGDHPLTGVVKLIAVGNANPNHLNESVQTNPTNTTLPTDLPTTTLVTNPTSFTVPPDSLLVAIDSQVPTVAPVSKRNDGAVINSGAVSLLFAPPAMPKRTIHKLRYQGAL